MLTLTAVLYHHARWEFQRSNLHTVTTGLTSKQTHWYAAAAAEPSEATGCDLPGSCDLAFRAEGHAEVNSVYTRLHRRVVPGGGGAGGRTDHCNIFTHPALAIAGLQKAKALAVVAPRLVQGVHKRPGAVDVALPVSVS